MLRPPWLEERTQRTVPSRPFELRSRGFGYCVVGQVGTAALCQEGPQRGGAEPGGGSSPEGTWGESAHLLGAVRATSSSPEASQVL